MDSMRGAGPHRSRAHELLALTLEGAHAKDRPDLIRRLTGVRQGLDDLAVRDTAKADEIAAGEALRALGTRWVRPARLGRLGQAGQPEHTGGPGAWGAHRCSSHVTNNQP